MERYGKQHGFAYLTSCMQDMCAPLQGLGISLVRFVRIYSDGQQLYLNKEHFSADFNFDDYDADGFSASDATSNTGISHFNITVLKHKTKHDDQTSESHVYDAFLLQNRSLTFTDTMYFIGREEMIADLCLNQPDLFKRFYYFFLDAGSHLIRSAQRQLVKQGSRDSIHSSQRESSHLPFISKTPINRFFVDQDIYLSSRECETLAWLGVGKTYDDIAEILGVAKRTIINHFESIKMKVHLKNLNELIRYSIKNNFPELFIT